jgi:hypothetical protein
MQGNLEHNCEQSVYVLEIVGQVDLEGLSLE